MCVWKRVRDGGDGIKRKDVCERKWKKTERSLASTVVTELVIAAQQV